MTSDSTKVAACSVDGLLFDNWFDPIETALRERTRNFIEELIHGELTAALDRPRYGRRGMKESPSALVGHRHGSRTRPLTGTFGTTEITVPRARIAGENGTTTEWKSKALRAYQRRTLAADATRPSRAQGAVRRRPKLGAAVSGRMKLSLQAARSIGSHRPYF
jgi:hypothetical protein